MDRPGSTHDGTLALGGRFGTMNREGLKSEMLAIRPSLLFLFLFLSFFPVPSHFTLPYLCWRIRTFGWASSPAYNGYQSLLQSRHPHLDISANLGIITAGAVCIGLCMRENHCSPSIVARLIQMSLPTQPSGINPKPVAPSQTPFAEKQVRFVPKRKVRREMQRAGVRSFSGSKLMRRCLGSPLPSRIWGVLRSARRYQVSTCCARCRYGRINPLKSISPQGR
jgi:hypothetical protein